MLNLDPPAHLVDGRTQGGAGAAVTSIDPFTGEQLWVGQGADPDVARAAVAAARRAWPSWRDTPLDARLAVLGRFVELVQANAEVLAQAIASEAGKPLWDARTEVNSLVTKLAASEEAYVRRAADSEREVRGLTSRTRFLPHGVMVVLGPFNFPMSMANSHIMPALLAGNAVVFKPSELTPRCGLLMAQLWREAGLPPGVLNCVTGGRELGSWLIEHDEVDGVLFIGSRAAGLSILRTLADRPEKIVALEMGGNSPLVVWDYDDIDWAVFTVVQSAMISAGQRCSAARRLIVRQDDRVLLERLATALAQLRIGHYRAEPEPYYGPLIRPAAAEAMTQQLASLEENGARYLLAPNVSGPAASLVSPTLIDMAECGHDPDEEIFGPALKVYRAATLDEAIAKANATRLGLAAGILCRERAVFDAFFAGVRAGIVNWNQQLTGATTYAPFGGVKQSGNHRPAGYLSVDYCSYAVASFEVEQPKLPDALPPGVQLRR